MWLRFIDAMCGNESRLANWKITNGNIEEVKA